MGENPNLMWAKGDFSEDKKCKKKTLIDTKKHWNSNYKSFSYNKICTKM